MPFMAILLSGLKEHKIGQASSRRGRGTSKYNYNYDNEVK